MVMGRVWLMYGLVTLLAVLLAVAAWAWWVHRQDQAQAHRVWQVIEGWREPDPPRYDPAMVAGLPEVAQRYFRHAIEPGTPLQRVVRLQMEGSFVLGGRPIPMRARQILAPAARGFVWEAEMGSGLMRFAGSDGYLLPAQGAAESWTKFWLHGLVPLARVGGQADHARAAATRVMLESVWAPASLLPAHGARWTQTGPHSAEVRFDQGPGNAPGVEPMRITLHEDGRLAEVQALRWSDANADKVYRLQPFGGRILDSGRFGGFRVPTRVEMGNHYGTSAYEPFFLAEARAEY